MNNTFSKNRVETFSDGIFAIIITLLVLEIKAPYIQNELSATELYKAILSLLPKFLGWIISFFTIAVIWVNHHKLFKQFKVLDSGIFWWNAILLLWTSFIPFPTALLGDYPKNPTSLIFYGMVMSLMASSFSMMRFYVLRKPSLLEDNVNHREFRKGSRLSILFGPIMYLLGVLASQVSPVISYLIYLGIPVYFIFAETRPEVQN